MRLCYPIASCVMLISYGTAQGLNSFGLPVQLGGFKGHITVIHQAKTESSLIWRLGSNSQHLRLPLGGPVCGAPVGTTVIICGRNGDDQSVALRVSESKGRLTFRKEQTYPDLRLLALVYDPVCNDLYALDQDGKILCSPNGSMAGRPDLESVASVPDAWTVAAPDPAGGLRVGYTRYYRAGKEWAQELIVPDVGPPIVLVVSPPSVQGPISVQIGEAGSLSLECNTGAVLRLGPASQGVGEYSLPTRELLDPTAHYRLVADIDGLAVASSWFRPRIRVGKVAVAGSIREMSLDGNAELCYPGSRMFMARGCFAVAKPGECHIVGWFRLVRPGELPDLTVRNGVTVLQPTPGFRSNLDATPIVDSVYAIRFAIPDQPALEGHVLYMQVCVEQPGSGVAVSDICGIALTSVDDRSAGLGRASWPVYAERSGIDKETVEAVAMRVVSGLGH